MTGPEGGINPKYNSFSVDTETKQPAASNEAVAEMHPVFEEFSKTNKLRELTSGPLNQIGWLMGNLNHDVIPYLSEDTINDMRSYVSETDEKKRRLLSEKIIAGFEEASGREMDEAA